MIVVNTELLRQMKTESVILREFSNIAKKLSDAEEYSGLKHLVDTVNGHAIRLVQLFEQFDNEVKESLVASASSRPAMEVTTVNLADIKKPVTKAITKPAPKKVTKDDTKA